MKSFAITSLLASSATAISVVSLGSSYSYGAGLTSSYGQLLTNRLAANGSTKYQNLAHSGSNLSSITDTQASQLKGQSPDIIVISAGGNDLNYVTCLDNPSLNYCGHTISESQFTKNWFSALNAIFSAVSNPSAVSVYVVDYPAALGPDTDCGSGNANCTASADQVKMIESIYTNLIDWTVQSVDNYNGNYTNHKLKYVPMRQYSTTHYVGTKDNWVRGNESAPVGGGDKWHPNPVGADFISLALYNLVTGKPVPCYQDCSTS